MHRAGPLGFHSGDERIKIVGVPHPSATRLTVEIMKLLGYRRGLSPCGGSYEYPDRFMDELSNVGPSRVAELHEDGTITEYELTPEDAGVTRASYAGIAPEPTREGNVRKLARVLANREKNEAVLDLIALNAASMLKLLGKTPSLREGVAAAREAVMSGRVLAQIEALIQTQNREPTSGLATLRSLLAD
jgi:anthranilate phosphoribosyltransferase